MGKNDVAGIFAKFRAKLQSALDELPVVVGNEGVNFTLEAFEKEAWEDLPWELRKDKKTIDRALLVKSGRLKRSVRVIRSSASSVVWGTDVPYAQVHNDGLPISRAARSETFVRPRYLRGPKSKFFGGIGAFRKMTLKEKNSAPVQGQQYGAYSYNMPRRRFIGDTPALRARLKDTAKQHILNAIKS